MTDKLNHILNQSRKLVEAGAKNLKEAPPPFPEEFYLELTYQCPQRCVMCDVWPRYREQPDLQEEELSLSEIKTLVNRSRYLQNLKSVVLTGGEPFFREDLVDLCGFFLKKYPRISLGILSSCFHPEMIAEKLIIIHRQYQPADLWLGSSLDGLKPNHDRIRGVEGSFTRVMETIALVRRHLPQQRFGINFTILPSNCDDLLEVFNLTRERDLEFSAQFPLRWHNLPRFRWGRAELGKVAATVRIIMELRTALHPEPDLERRPLGNAQIDLLSELFYWQHLVSYQQKPRRLFPWCPAGEGYAMFNPQGGLYFCPKLKYEIVGRIRDQVFDEIWQNQPAGALRKMIRSGGCHCWLNCSVYSAVRAALKSLR